MKKAIRDKLAQAGMNVPSIPAPISEFRMPFGHYKGQPLTELPDVYLIYLAQRLEHDARLLQEELAKRDARY
jgi:hypothetical protein